MSPSSSEPDSSLGIAAGMVITVLFHAALFGGLYYYKATEAAAAATVDEDLLEFEAAELLMYGEVMPEPGELPVIANPAPEEQPEDIVELQEPEEEVAVVEPEEEPPPEQQPVQREEEDEEDVPRDDSRHNPNRETNTERLRGSRDGSPGGTSLSETALANLFGRAQAQIQRAFRPPGSIGRDQLSSLSARVRVFVNEDGRITRYSWVDRSGNSLYDSAVERALNNFRLGSQRLHLPTHHEQAMRQVLQHGFVVAIEP